MVAIISTCHFRTTLSLFRALNGKKTSEQIFPPWESNLCSLLEFLSINFGALNVLMESLNVFEYNRFDTGPKMFDSRLPESGDGCCGNLLLLKDKCTQALYIFLTSAENPNKPVSLFVKVPLTPISFSGETCITRTRFQRTPSTNGNQLGSLISVHNIY